MTSSILQVRVDKKIKKEANEILHNLGFDMSSAVRLFLNRVIISQGLPFPMNTSVNEEEVDDFIRKNKENEEETKGFDVIKYIETYISENQIEVT